MSAHTPGKGERPRQAGTPGESYGVFREREMADEIKIGRALRRSTRIARPDEMRRFLRCPGCRRKRLFSEYEGRCDECRKADPRGEQSR
jgi:hypothetical protein